MNRRVEFFHKKLIDFYKIRIVIISKTVRITAINPIIIKRNFESELTQFSYLTVCIWGF